MSNPTRTMRERLANTLAKEFGYEGQFEGGHLEEMYDRDYWLSYADRCLAVVGERMDELAIVEPATTWEAAYKGLRHEVGGAASS